MDNVDTTNQLFRANNYSYHAEHVGNGIMNIYECAVFIIALPVNTPFAQVLQALNVGPSTVVVSGCYGQPSLGQVMAEGVANGVGFGIGNAVINSLFGGIHHHDTTVIRETIVYDDGGDCEFFSD